MMRCGLQAASCGRTGRWRGKVELEGELRRSAEIHGRGCNWPDLRIIAGERVQPCEMCPPEGIRQGRGPRIHTTRTPEMRHRLRRLELGAAADGTALALLVCPACLGNGLLMRFRWVLISLFF